MSIPTPPPLPDAALASALNVPPGAQGLVPSGFAEKAMASLMQMHGELMEEKERRVELHRRLMEREQALAEMRMYVQLLEDRLHASTQPAPAPASAPEPIAPVAAPVEASKAPVPEAAPAPRAPAQAPRPPQASRAAKASDGWKVW